MADDEQAADEIASHVERLAADGKPSRPLQ
jgi:hypothetical protein